MEKNVAKIEIDFLTAGKAQFMVSNPKGDKFIYKIVKKLNNRYTGKVYKVPVYFVHGKPSNGAFAYMGMYNPNSHTMKFTQNSKFESSDSAVKVMKWSVNKVITEDELPNGYDIVNVGKCAQCGRSLTDDHSKKWGFGPLCIKGYPKVLEKIEKSKKLAFLLED